MCVDVKLAFLWKMTLVFQQVLALDRIKFYCLFNFDMVWNQDNRL